MRYREFGAGTLSGVNLIVQPDRQLCLAAVRRAIDLGINWFDTAPSYGDAEERLGWALSELGATPYVSTKVAIGTEHLDDIAGEVERSVESSLRRLRRDHIDLIQLHSAVTEARGTYGGGSITPEDVLGEGGCSPASSASGSAAWCDSSDSMALAIYRRFER